jgi:RNA polymerase sigma-70 factor (ECF subfamily)
MGLADSSDADLVRSLRAGQQKALEVIYDRYIGLVYSVAYKVLGNSQEAEDLTQDIFVTFWQQDSFDPSRGSLKSFLGLLTRSRAVDKIRRRNTTNSFLERWQKIITEESSDPLPLEQASMEECQEAVQQAMQQISGEHRQILEMNYYKGLSQAKISQELNLSLGVVKHRSRQGMIELRKLLHGMCG